MKLNFLYQVTAASRTLTRGLLPPDPHSLRPLSSTEFVETPPLPNKIPGYATAARYSSIASTYFELSYNNLTTTQRNFM